MSDLWLYNKCPDLEAPNTETCSVLDQCHQALVEAVAPSILPLLTVILNSASGGHKELSSCLSLTGTLDFLSHVTMSHTFLAGLELTS